MTSQKSSTHPACVSGNSGYVESLRARKERLNSANLLLPATLYGQYHAASDSYCFTDQGGFIPTREEFEELVELLREFYERNGADAIRDHNRDRYREIYEETPVANRPTNRNRPPESGYVYLLQGEGSYKIGRAKNPHSRAEQLAIQLPYAVRLVHTFFARDYRAAEEALHEQFADKRLNGEWFDLDAEDVAYIKGLSE